MTGGLSSGTVRSLSKKKRYRTPARSLSLAVSKGERAKKSTLARNTQQSKRDGGDRVVGVVMTMMMLDPIVATASKMRGPPLAVS